MEFIKETTQILKVLEVKAEYTDARIIISAECETKSGWGNETFVIAKIFKDWKCQGNYTYFKGSLLEKEYKGVKAVLSAVDKWVLSINGNNEIWYYNKDEILIYTGLKKKPEDTRRCKQFMKKLEAEKLENKEVEIVVVETIEDIKEVAEVELVQIYPVITTDLISYETMTLQGLEIEINEMNITLNNLNNDLKLNNDKIEKYKDDNTLTLKLLVTDLKDENIRINRNIKEVNKHIEKINECINTFEQRYNNKFNLNRPFIKLCLSSDMDAIEIEPLQQIKEVETIVNDFTLDCMAIIECIVNKDSSGADNIIKDIYNNYSKNNMIETIKYINKELIRLELNLDAEYITAFNRLKEILKKY